MDLLVVFLHWKDGNAILLDCGGASLPDPTHGFDWRAVQGMELMFPGKRLIFLWIN